MDNALVGVLLDRSVLRRARTGRPSHENLSFYRKFARQGVCFFSIAGVDLINRRVRAYTYGSDGQLVQSDRPLPRVIHYRSIAFDPRDKRRAVELSRLPGYHVFNNPRCGGKLSNCRWLAEEPSLRANVPETRRYEGPETLAELLESYRAVILKPIWGSLGLGLIRVSRAKGGGYWWQTGTSGRRYCQTIEAVDRALHHRTSTRPYLAQRWLDMATYQGKPFDVRVTVQKGGDGRWHVSGLTAKVGGRNPIATNVARGGRAVSLSHVLPAAFGEDAQSCYDRLAELGLKLAPVLAKHEAGAADYGFDLCLTKDGHPWFLEANHRDLRYAFRDAGDRAMWATTYRNPMEYAAYLAKRPKETDDRA